MSNSSDRVRDPTRLLSGGVVKHTWAAFVPSKYNIKKYMEKLKLYFYNRIKDVAMTPQVKKSLRFIPTQGVRKKREENKISSNKRNIYI